MTDSPQRRYLYPEMIERPDLTGGEVLGWTVTEPNRETPIGVLLDEQSMVVPQYLDACARCHRHHNYGIQQREMGHLLFTNAAAASALVSMGGVSAWLMGAVEDVRVNRRLTLAGYPNTPPVQCISEYESMHSYFWDHVGSEPISESDRARGVIMNYYGWVMIRSLFTLVSSDEGLSKWVWYWGPYYDRIRNYRRHVPQHTQFIEATEKIMSILHQEVIDHPDPTSDQWMRATYRIHKILGPSPTQFEEEEESKRTASPLQLNKQGKEHTPVEEQLDRLEGDPDQLWEKTEVVEPPRTVNMIDARKRTHTARDEGTVPQNIHRLMTDGRLFRQRKKVPETYSILIDTSGSMSWPEDEIHELLKAIPRASVAAYSGTGPEGYLKILALDGKRVADDELKPPPGGNNDCDGVALRWLNTQPGKRIWLSDGGVNGRGYDVQAEYQDAAVQVIRGRVMRVREGQTLLDVVNGKRDHKPSNWHNAVGWNREMAEKNLV